MTMPGLSCPPAWPVLVFLVPAACGGGGSKQDASSDAVADLRDDAPDAAGDGLDVTDGAPDPDAEPDASGDPVTDAADGAETGDAPRLDAPPDAADGGEEEAAGFCPDVEGGLVYRMTADFVPTPGEPTLTLMVPCEGGLAFGVVTVELDLTHGGWFEAEPDGTHGIFQLTRGTRWRSNLYGFMTLFGPPRNEVKVISNIDLPAGEVLRLNRTGIRLEEGVTYHIRYTYDTSLQERRLLVTSGGDVVLDIADAQTVDEVSTLAPGFQMVLATADSGDAGPEVPTYGWRYANLCIRILP